MKIWLLLSFISFILPENKYLPFNEKQKQEKFLKLKLSVSKFKNNAGMIQGGGAEFSSIEIYNDLINTLQNIKGLNIDKIETDFIFEYKHEIIQNNIILDDIKFLRIVGQFERADSTLTNYKKKLIDYYQSKAFFYSDSAEAIKIAKLNEVKRGTKKNELSLFRKMFLSSAAYLSLSDYNIQKCINDDNCNNLNERFDKLDKHFELAQKDLELAKISQKKVYSRGSKIVSIDVEDKSDNKKIIN